MKQDIVIIGAGIGGLTAAISLRRAGFSVHVYERAPELREAGAAISIMPNATRVLREFGLLEQLLACGEPITAGVIQPNNGRALMKPMALTTDVPGILLHRADLQEVLLSAVPADCLHLGNALTGISQTDAGVTAQFAGGLTVEADLLIGADGLHSTARACLLADGPPIYRGYQCWRGVNPAAHVETVAEIIGRGVRAGLVPMGRRGAAWWVCANESETASDEPEGRLPKLLRLLEGWHESVRSVIAGTPAGATFKNAIYDRPARRGWSRGRALLIGDAAHPAAPNLGQGGGMAIEDAALLARCLAQFSDHAAAFRNFEALRFARVKKIVNFSRLWGVIGQWKNPLACWFRNRLLSATPNNRTLKQLLELWSYDILKVPLPS